MCPVLTFYFYSLPWFILQKKKRQKQANLNVFHILNLSLSLYDMKQKHFQIIKPFIQDENTSEYNIN